jgi:hypothetical protein
MRRADSLYRKALPMNADGNPIKTGFLKCQDTISVISVRVAGLRAKSSQKCQHFGNA